MAKHITPTFNKVIKGTTQGEKILPVLRAYLYDSKFPSFDIHMEGMTSRKFDGYFHPSTHPLWTDRQLYFYMSFPELLVREPLDPLGTLAVTSGNFWHKFLTICGTEAGIFLGHDIPVCDEDTKSRGEMDLILDGEAGELKTMNAMKLNKLPKGGPSDPVVIDAWKKLVPQYDAQAQEYMRLSGYRTMRFLVLDVGYPFAMREIALPYDSKLANEIGDKYKRVLQAVADQKMPEQCCNPRSPESQVCPSRGICPVGRM